jgi:hypothetical protein
LNKKKEEITPELTTEEIWDVLKFAQELGGSAFYGGALTPMLLNSRMKDISLNPLQATEDSLANALKKPKDSEIDLQAFSQDFEIQSQVYRKLLSYLGNMLSFDLTFECTNIENESEYKSKAYLKDRAVVAKFLDTFEYKKEFGTVVRQMLRNEAYFCVPRFDGKKIVLQELPSSPTYTMITGRWEYGLNFSFNMYWFLQPGVDLRMYPRFFSEKYNEIWGSGKGLSSYNPALPTSQRGDSSWVYWQDIPTNLGWCWKINPEIATRLPYFTGLFLDLVQQPLIRSLQKNINIAAASRILIGSVGMLKDAKASVKDQFNINPDVLGKFLSLVKAGVGDAIRVAAAPLENMEAVSYPAENEVYNSYLKTALATSGVNTNLIFTSDVRPNAIESQLSLNVDEQQMYALYPQFNAFLDYWVNKNTSKYKFKFYFEGSEFFNNRELRLGTAMTLANAGIVLPQKISAAIGMSPFSFERQMAEGRANGFVENLTPLISEKDTEDGTTASGEKMGRPRKKQSELSDSGAETRSAGSNIEKGTGKI